MIEMNYNAVNLRVYNILCFTAYGEHTRIKQHEFQYGSAVHHSPVPAHDSRIGADDSRKLPISVWQSW